MITITPIADNRPESMVAVVNRAFADIEAALNRLEEPFWNNLGASATQIKGTGSAGSATWDNTNLGWSFDSAATNTLEIILQMDHGLDEVNGNAAIPVWYWVPLNTDTGNVRWRLEWKWYNPDEAAPAFTVQTFSSAAPGTAARLTKVSGTSITKTSPKIDSVVELKLSRLGADAADTHTGAAVLKWAGLHVRRDDGRGSVYEQAKR